MSEGDLAAAMWATYEACLKLRPPYRASYFASMVQERGALAAAQQLLAGPVERVSEGFTKLIMDYGRPDLTVEWVALRDPHSAHFTLEERLIAYERLLKSAPVWAATHLGPPPAD